MFTTIKNQNSSYQIIEMRITILTSFKDMTYEHYFKQPLPMCKILLIKFLPRNPSFINCLNRNTFFPVIRLYNQIPQVERYFQK